MSEHPQRATLERFLRGEASPAESRRVVLHLLAGCGQCLRQVRSSWRAVGEEGAAQVSLHPSSYAGLVERAMERQRLARRRLEAERFRAPEVLRELLAGPPEDRLCRVLFEELPVSPTLVRCLIEESGSRYPGGAAAIEMAELAAAAAGRIDPADYGELVVLDLRAAAWRALAECRLAAGDVRGARIASGVVRHTLGAMGSPLAARVEADLLEARVCAVADGPEVALAVLEELGRHLEHQGGESSWQGRVELERGALRDALGDARGAIRELIRGLRRVDPARQPRPALAAHLRLVRLLRDEGRLGEALLHGQRARQLVERHGDVEDRHRLEWLEGRLADALGRSEEALHRLGRAWGGLLAAGRGPEGAQAALDLARLHRRRSDRRELERLGRRLGVATLTPGLRRDVAEALLLVERAAASGRLGEGLVEQLARYLQATA